MRGLVRAAIPIATRDNDIAVTVGGGINLIGTRLRVIATADSDLSGNLRIGGWWLPHGKSRFQLQRGGPQWGRTATMYDQGERNQA